MILLLSADFFQNQLLQLSGTVYYFEVSNDFDPDLSQGSVDPNLEPGCLQMLSEVDKSHRKQEFIQTELWIYWIKMRDPISEFFLSFT